MRRTHICVERRKVGMVVPTVEIMEVVEVVGSSSVVLNCAPCIVGMLHNGL